MPDDLKIPYKFSGQNPWTGAAIRRILAKYESDAPVTTTQLERILPEVFKYFGENDRQNWLEIERWAARNKPAGIGSLFDAIIDPAQTTADPVLHIYPNLASLVANESWDEEFIFNAGMRGRPGDAVVDDSPVTVPGPMTITGIMAGQYANLQDDGQWVDWDLQDIVTMPAFPNGNMGLYGLRIFKSTSGNVSAPLFNNATVALVNCNIESFSGTNQRYSTFAESMLTAINTWFLGHSFNGTNVVILHDCHFSSASASNYTLSSDEFMWIGGSWNSNSSSVNVTLDGDDSFIQLFKNNFAWSSSGGGRPTFILAGSGNNHYLEMWGELNRPNVTVTATGLVTVKGDYNNITVSGTTDFTRHITGTFSGTADITSHSIVNLASTADAAQILFKGDGIRADVRIRGNASPALELVGCDDSLIVATLDASSAAGRPYNIDNNSDRSILIVAGSNNTWANPGTNSSPTSIVIDENGASGSGGTVSRYLVGQFYQENVAASQTNIALNLFDGGGGVTRASRLAMRAGSVTGIVVRSNAARTAGTLTVEATINAAGTGLTAVLDGTNTTVKATTQNIGLDTFVAGGELGARITTDGAWAVAGGLPTADISVELEVSG